MDENNVILPSFTEFADISHLVFVTVDGVEGNVEHVIRVRDISAIVTEHGKCVVCLVTGMRIPVESTPMDVYRKIEEALEI